MSYTAQDAINETLRHLMGGQRDVFNVLADNVDPDVTNLRFYYPVASIQIGAYIAIDLEIVYVVDTNPGTNNATVIRGQLGTSNVLHTAGTQVTVNPRFTQYDILQALNRDIRDLSSPTNGLFQVKTIDAPYLPPVAGYDLGVSSDQVIGIIDVRYQTAGPSKAYPRINGDFGPGWQLERDMPVADFASTTALRVDKPGFPGKPLHVKYAAPFNELVSLTDDLVSDAHLPATAVDIPSLGAAAFLMFNKEAKRAFTEAQNDTRRATEVPPGSATRAASTLQALRSQRINSEATRLARAFPMVR